MLEQKKFYSIAYSEQNIHETQEHSEQKNNSKSPDKKGGGGGLKKKQKNYCI